MQMADRWFYFQHVAHGSPFIGVTNRTNVEICFMCVGLFITIAQSGTGTIGQLARILLPDSHSLNV